MRDWWIAINVLNIAGMHLLRVQEASEGPGQSNFLQTYLKFIFLFVFDLFNVMIFSSNQR
jgi:hypothetical protein